MSSRAKKPAKTTTAISKSAKKASPADWLTETAAHLARWENDVTPYRISLIRRSYRLDRPAFAQRIGVTEKKLAGWEAGTSRPTRLQRRLLVILWKGSAPRASRQQKDLFMGILA